MAADPNEIANVVAALANALTANRVPYFITGSLASSMHGEFRATNDIDVVADFRVGDIGASLAELSGEFLMDVDEATRAAAGGRSFNLIHLGSYMKVDFFAASGDFEHSAIARSVSVSLAGAPGTFAIASMEDVLLAKLRWYELGQRESAVQWRDIVRLVELNRGRLELAYLQTWSWRMGTHQLLERALSSESSERND